ncbi:MULTISPECIES: hypothetical protein [unclassified Blastococcus]
MTDLTTRRVREHPVPAPPAEQAPDAAAPIPGRAPSPPGGVPLDRLLALARPSPAQALELGAAVLAAAATRAAAAGGTADDGAAGDPTVVAPLVAADGRVRLATGPAGRPADAVLTDVAAAARLPGPPPDPAAGRHLDALDRAARDLPAAGLPAVSGRLQEAATGLDRAAVRAELAALVRAVGGPAVGGPAVGGPAAGGARPGGRPAAARAEPARPADGAPRRRSGRRVGAWVLSLLVLAAVVTTEVVLLRDDITADIGLLLDAGRDEDDPAAAPEPPAPSVPAPAPAAAGTVAAVDLRPLERCVPGAPCTVRLLVRLLPTAEPQVVTWTYQVLDPCTGGTGSWPGGTVTVPPQADRAAAVGTIPLPALAAVAVVAVTDVPAVAASGPVLAGSCASD